MGGGAGDAGDPTQCNFITGALLTLGSSHQGLDLSRTQISSFGDEKIGQDSPHSPPPTPYPGSKVSPFKEGGTQPAFASP